jgi:hypothetical protein
VDSTTFRMHFGAALRPPPVRVIGAGTQKRQPRRHERRTPDIFRLGRIIHYSAALLGCILPEASRQTYLVPQTVESARYSNFLAARGHY